MAKKIEDKTAAPDMEQKSVRQDAPADESAARPTERREASPLIELHSLDELALSFRVPTWQQAALLRLMGWTEDKSVSEAAYADALDALNSRRMGGGRKE